MQNKTEESMSMKSEWFSDIAFTLDFICKFSRIDIGNDNGRGFATCNETRVGDNAAKQPR